jgi:large subunit ribosomal protein L32
LPERQISCADPADAKSTTGPRRYTATPLAVPKQKQSHSRTNKRRSQHKITPPSTFGCPQCHEPKLSHRVCRNCGYYAGREIVAQAIPDFDE